MKKCSHCLSVEGLGWSLTSLLCSGPWGLLHSQPGVTPGVGGTTISQALGIALWAPPGRHTVLALFIAGEPRKF